MEKNTKDGGSVDWGDKKVRKVMDGMVFICRRCRSGCLRRRHLAHSSRSARPLLDGSHRLTDRWRWTTDACRPSRSSTGRPPCRTCVRRAHAQYSRAPAARLMQCTVQCRNKTRIAASWVDWLAYGLTALSTHNYEGHIAPLVKSRKHLNHTLIKILHTGWYIVSRKKGR